MEDCKNNVNVNVNVNVINSPELSLKKVQSCPLSLACY